MSARYYVSHKGKKLVALVSMFSKDRLPEVMGIIKINFITHNKEGYLINFTHRNFTKHISTEIKFKVPIDKSLLFRKYNFLKRMFVK